MAMHLMGVYLIGVYLMGMHLMGMYLMGTYLKGVAKSVSDPWGATIINGACDDYQREVRCMAVLPMSRRIDNALAKRQERYRTLWCDDYQGGFSKGVSLAIYTFRALAAISGL